MNNDNTGSDNNDFPTIKPADISLTRGDAAKTGSGERSVAAAAPLSRRIKLALGLLLIGVIGVVFFLPAWVERSATTPGDNDTAGNQVDTPEASPASSDGGSGTDPTPAASPWSEAQLAELRKQSQDLLAEMLEAKKKLEEDEVEQWAGEAYDEALAIAEKGDAAYQERHFNEAVDLYRQALEQLTGLLDSMGQVYNEAMEQGRQALDDGQAEAAAEHFDQALLIRPDDEAAQRGRQRARTLDEVNALIAAGNEALEGGRLAEAKKKYSEALDIDPYADAAEKRLKETDKRIHERDFRQTMSAGYTALEKDRLEPAREAFNRALQLKPGSDAAAEALKQTKERITTGRINDHLQAAKEAVAGEEWQKAVEHYRQALALDDNLSVAQQGLQRANRRADLDQLLERTIANPERLWDEAVRQASRSMLQQAREIQPAGEKLSQQITTLERLLEKAAAPVTVQLRSDNQTNVTIYKVGDMGQFEEKSITLKPGRYVAVGSRSGYRDVRVEFTVHPDEPAEPVVIKTREKINLGAG